MKSEIAIDMDGVCCEFVPELCKEYYKATGKILKPEDITDWDIRKFGITDEMWIKPGFFRGLEPVEGALEVLWKYRYKYNFVIATDTMGIDFVQKDKQWWLDRYMPFIKNVHYTSDKSFLNSIALLDDAPHHLNDFPNLKIKMVNPYNEGVYADYIVENWRDVDSIFKHGFANRKGCRLNYGK